METQYKGMRTSLPQKPSQVQEQLIENLRHELAEAHDELELERTRSKEALLDYDRELKAAQRQIHAHAKTLSHLEVRCEELAREGRAARAALLEERQAAKEIELEAARAAKDATVRLNQANERASRMESERELARSEVTSLKNALESERAAVASLLREHNAEVKSLREELRTRTCESYKELHERGIREQEEQRNIRLEAEKTLKIMEQDFRALINEKEEEIRQVRADAKATQKALEEQLRNSLKATISKRDVLAAAEGDLVRSLRHEVAILKVQNKKLEKQLQTANDAFVEATNRDRIKYENMLAEREREVRTEVQKLLQALKEKDTTVLKQQKVGQKISQGIAKLRLRCLQHTRAIQTNKTDGCKKKQKPLLPVKSAKVLERKSSISRDKGVHVKDMVRQLQEKDARTTPTENDNNKASRLSNSFADINDNTKSTNRTIEDLKAIDADIERLRRQIEDRDTIILRLREESRGKDEQLQLLMSRRQSQSLVDVIPAAMCSSPDASSDSCSGSDGPSPTPIENLRYLGLISERLKQRTRVQTNDNENIDENHNSGPGIQEALLKEVTSLKEKEAALAAEANFLREQNDLLEFRILELECRPSNDDNQPIWSSRDVEDVSDSGIMSLPTSEDLTSDSDQGDIFGHIVADHKLTGVATVFSGIQSIPDKSRKIKCFDCLQESGIFDDGDLSRSTSVFNESISFYRLASENKGCQTDAECPRTPELSEELFKLTEIQKRIKLKENSEQRSSYSFCIADYIDFYEEKVNQLQEKLTVYESCGDQRDKLLSKRLEKEMSLTQDIKRLKEKVANLEEKNMVLEEERCEFEEAENDSRLQCQRLESQLQELVDAKIRLESEVQCLQMNTLDAQRKNKKDTSETITNLQDELKEFKKKHKDDQQRLRHLENYLEEKEEKMAALLQLKLEASAADVKFISKDLGLDVGTNEYCVENNNEEVLRERIENLEKTNQAFFNTLSEADQIWATLEENYKEQIKNMKTQYEEQLENQNMDLENLRKETKRLSEELVLAKNRLSKLSDTEVTNAALKTQMETILDECAKKMDKLKMIEKDNDGLQSKVLRLSNELQVEKTANELRILEERKKLEEVEKNLQNKLNELNQELTKKNKEVCDLEVTTSELREEVETLEAPLSPQKKLFDTFFPILHDNKELARFPSTTGNTILTTMLDKRILSSSAVSFEKVTLKMYKLVSDLLNLLYSFQISTCKQQPHNECSKFILLEQDKEQSDDVEAAIINLSIGSDKLQSLLLTLEEENKDKDMKLKQLKSQLNQSLKELNTLFLPDNHPQKQTSSESPPGTSLTLTTPISTLQLALDNLQLKCRTKSGIAQALLSVSSSSSHSKDQNLWCLFNNTRTRRFRDLSLSTNSGMCSSPTYSTDKDESSDSSYACSTEASRSHSYAATLNEFLSCAASVNLATNSSPEQSADLRVGNEINQHNPHNLHRTAPVARFGPSFPITNVCRIGARSLCLGWDNRRLPVSVIGYEISVNGKVCHRVPQGDRSRVILDGLRFTKRMVICVHPLTMQGRMQTAATTIYPPLLPEINLVP